MLKGIEPNAKRHCKKNFKIFSILVLAIEYARHCCRDLPAIDRAISEYHQSSICHIDWRLARFLGGWKSEIRSRLGPYRKTPTGIAETTQADAIDIFYGFFQEQNADNYPDYLIFGVDHCHASLNEAKQRSMKKVRNYRFFLGFGAGGAAAGLSLMAITSCMIEYARMAGSRGRRFFEGMGNRFMRPAYHAWPGDGKRISK